MTQKVKNIFLGVYRTFNPWYWFQVIDWSGTPEDARPAEIVISYGYQQKRLIEWEIHIPLGPVAIAVGIWFWWVMWG